jgi:hypothetical protein
MASDYDIVSFKKGYAKMLSTAGVLATRKLIQKLDSPEADRANIGSLAVIAGIMTDKTISLDAEEPVKTVDWSDLLGA